LLSAPQGGRWLGECLTLDKKCYNPCQKKTADKGSKRRPGEHNFIEFTELPVQLTILKSANENQYSGDHSTEELTLNGSAHTVLLFVTVHRIFRRIANVDVEKWTRLGDKYLHY